MICVAIEICETVFQSSVEAGGLFSNMADFHGHRHLVAEKPWEGSFNKLYVCNCMYLEFLIHLLIGPIFQDAILDLENNRVYCSRNNSLLSFSAPDWLPPL